MEITRTIGTALRDRPKIKTSISRCLTSSDRNCEILGLFLDLFGTRTCLQKLPNIWQRSTCSCYCRPNAVPLFKCPARTIRWLVPWPIAKRIGWLIRTRWLWFAASLHRHRVWGWAAIVRRWTNPRMWHENQIKTISDFAELGINPQHIMQKVSMTFELTDMMVSLLWRPCKIFFQRT